MSSIRSQSSSLRRSLKISRSSGSAYRSITVAWYVCRKALEGADRGVAAAGGTVPTTSVLARERYVTESRLGRPPGGRTRMTSVSQLVICRENGGGERTMRPETLA
jgi:hypothetical protein